jgi:hypothetical protein
MTSHDENEGTLKPAAESPRILGMSLRTYSVVGAFLALLAIPLVLTSAITVTDGVVVGGGCAVAALWTWREHSKITNAGS